MLTFRYVDQTKSPGSKCEFLRLLSQNEYLERHSRDYSKHQHMKMKRLELITAASPPLKRNSVVAVTPSARASRLNFQQRNSRLQPVALEKQFELRAGRVGRYLDILV